MDELYTRSTHCIDSGYWTCSAHWGLSAGTWELRGSDLLCTMSGECGDSGQSPLAALIVLTVSDN